MKYILSFLLIGMLGGCQFKHPDNTQKTAAQIAAEKRKAFFLNRHGNQNDIKDSAPKGPIPTFFNKVKPVIEPLSRYGNPSTYKVDGHTYEVMPNPIGYKKRGLASWYGVKFHKRRTSSGENYDMYALTAAHKTLPLPTYVRVKNLSNGRQAIVKVNDRGPFHSGRVIDLSYGAAAKLGVLPKGVAPVEIEAIILGKQSHQAHYYVQAGAFNSQKLADALRIKLKKISKSPVLIEKYQKRYVVRVGPFANRTMSDHLRQSLSSHGVHGAFSVMM